MFAHTSGVVHTVNVAIYDGNFYAKNKELNKTWTSYVPENFLISFLITGYVFKDYRYYENTQKSLIDTTMKH